MKYPLVSIIIINYNGKLLLKNCISSILKNNYHNYEIIVSDNASSDGSIYLIKKTFTSDLSKIKFVKLSKNYGPSFARNEGFKISKGKYISFLDNDTEVDKNWISEAVNLFIKNSKLGVIQCKLLLLNQKNRIDYVGEFLGNLGFLKPIGPYGDLDKGQYNKSYPILAAKSAGMFISRNAFIKAGQFDSDYFIFMEETDLGWRTWLSGYQNVLCPKSIVYHQFSSTKNIVSKDFNNYLIRFHGTKNYIQTLIKNLSILNLIKILPIHLFLWFSLDLFLLLTGKFKSSFNIFRGIIWNLINLSKTLKKRHIIQKNRKITDNTLFKTNHLMVKTSLRSYITNFYESQQNISTPEN